jgi:hypothetical protein
MARVSSPLEKGFSRYFLHDRSQEEETRDILARQFLKLF